MNWPHAPKHWLFEPGIYMVTAGTYQKAPHLNSPARLDFFLESLFNYAAEFDWSLRAWAILANHYHFLASSPSDPATLRKFIGKLHMKTAQELNRQDATPGRKVWFQFWDSHITFERSYFRAAQLRSFQPGKTRSLALGRKLQMVLSLMVCPQCFTRLRRHDQKLQNRQTRDPGQLLIARLFWDCGDTSPLWNWETCLPVKSADMSAHSKELAPLEVFHLVD